MAKKGIGSGLLLVLLAVALMSLCWDSMPDLFAGYIRPHAELIYRSPAYSEEADGYVCAKTEPFSIGRRAEVWWGIVKWHNADFGMYDAKVELLDESGKILSEQGFSPMPRDWFGMRGIVLEPNQTYYFKVSNACIGEIREAHYCNNECYNEFEVENGVLRFGLWGEWLEPQLTPTPMPTPPLTPTETPECFIAGGCAPVLFSSHCLPGGSDYAEKWSFGTLTKSCGEGMVCAAPAGSKEIVCQLQEDDTPFLKESYCIGTRKYVEDWAFAVDKDWVCDTDEECVTEDFGGARRAVCHEIVPMPTPVPTEPPVVLSSWRLVDGECIGVPQQCPLDAGYCFGSWEECDGFSGEATPLWKTPLFLVLAVIVVGFIAYSIVPKKKKKKIWGFFK